MEHKTKIYDIASRKIALLSVAVMVIVMIVVISNARAQSISQPVISWQANNFFPSDYVGKALPSTGTRVSLSVMVIKGAKVLDLSGARIFWYVDEKLISREDEPTVAFAVTKRGGDSHFVRVVVESKDGKFENSTRVPVVRPSLAVGIPYPNNTVPQNSELRLRAIPFFFNVSSLDGLKFSWRVGEERITSVSENELVLKVGKPLSELQRNLLLTASAENVGNPGEIGEEIVRIKIK